MTETMPITFDPPGFCEAVQMGVIPAGSVLHLPAERFDQLALHLYKLRRAVSERIEGKELTLGASSGGHVTVMRGDD